jgi:hypothetical protein
MSFVKSFKSFQNAEEKAATDVTLGANPQAIDEDDAAILTDPALTQLRDNKRALEKQLEVLKQQEDVKLKELAAKAVQAKTVQSAAANAAANSQSAAPAGAPSV